MGVFGDLNEVRLIGNITQDLEIRRTSSGTAVMNFSIATNRNYKAGDDWKEETTFHNIVVWGNDAEQLEQRARKGTKVFVAGRIQTRKWEGNDGKTNYRTEVVAYTVTLLDRYEKTNSEGGSSNTKDTNYSSASEEPSADSSIDPDDLPF
ncbi:single-stranded DNA-binding protein [Candidatus Dojkabacteria bacterium]|uniref:Single-stranded DNA-binding protein n=1 Tax=Candidatus Dojkabacteria bacterium TaxID=2099670 RepID=A0A955L7V1_9BACT|nr:single-stranded DNA-binding protein [Candidatus Dojkabacteria bacterium]